MQYDLWHAQQNREEIAVRNFILALAQRRARINRIAHQATTLNPFFATSVRNFGEAPPGRFSSRSHRLTGPVVTLRLFSSRTR